MIKGELAMSIAMLYPGGQGKKDEGARTSAETADVSMRRVQAARQVLRHSIDLAHAVRDDALVLVRSDQEAMAYPDPAKRGGARDRGKSMSTQSTLEIDRTLIMRARRVLSYSAELAGMVMAE